MRVKRGDIITYKCVYRRAWVNELSLFKLYCLYLLEGKIYHSFLFHAGMLRPRNIAFWINLSRFRSLSMRETMFYIIRPQLIVTNSIAFAPSTNKSQMGWRDAYLVRRDSSKRFECALCYCVFTLYKKSRLVHNWCQLERISFARARRNYVALVAVQLLLCLRHFICITLRGCKVIKWYSLIVVVAVMTRR